MTSREAEASQVREISRGAEARSVVPCGFCLRRLAGEFFFTCRTCEASYCYIHTSRHQPQIANAATYHGTTRAIPRRNCGADRSPSTA